MRVIGRWAARSAANDRTAIRIRYIQQIDSFGLASSRGQSHVHVDNDMKSMSMNMLVEGSEPFLSTIAEGHPVKPADRNDVHVDRGSFWSGKNWQRSRSLRADRRRRPVEASEPQARGLSPGGPERSGGGAKRPDQGARRRLTARALVVTAFPFPSCLGVRGNGNGNPLEKCDRIAIKKRTHAHLAR